MQNKNSKSESYIVREAEGIIEKYIEHRENSDIKKYFKLKEKYEKLKILTFATLIITVISTLLSVIIK